MSRTQAVWQIFAELFKFAWKKLYLMEVPPLLRKLVWGVALALCSVTALAYGGTMMFRHISAAQGLSHITANDICADSLGVIWIATNDGLNRYDGAGIQVFRRNADTPGADNAIRKVVNLGDGTLALLSSDGVSRFDCVNSQFSTIFRGHAGAATWHNSLYIAHGNKILRADSDSLLCVACLDSTVTVTAIVVSDDGIWAGTRSDGVLLTLPNGETKTVWEGVSTRVSSLYQDSSGDIWAGTWEDGLIQIHDSQVVRHFRSGPGRSAISSDFVRCCTEDGDGNIWAGTINGLDRIGRDGKVTHFGADPDDALSLSDNSVWAIHRDRQDNLWVCTYYGGVNWFNPARDSFGRYWHSGGRIGDAIVRCLAERDEKHLWIGTEQGLDCLDRGTGEIVRCNASPGSGVAFEHLKSLYADRSAGSVWLASDMGGLICLDVASGEAKRWRHVPGDNGSIPSNRVLDITPYNGDSLVVATHGGLYMMSKQTGNGHPLLNDDIKGYVSDVLVDSYGALWAAAGGHSLLRYDFSSGRLSRWSDGRQVGRLFQDKEGNVWVTCADRGLMLCRAGRDSLETLDIGADGISSMAQLPVSGDLLLVCSDGFVTYAPGQGQTRRYLWSDLGLPNSPGEKSVLVTRDGMIYIGGVPGIISFGEEALNAKRLRADILISGVWTDNKRIGFSSDTVEIDSGISSLSIGLTVTNYVPASRAMLQYRIEGISEEWSDVPDSRVIIVPRLSPGRHLLTVRTAPDDEVQCPPLSILVRVISRVSPWHIAAALVLLLALSALSLLSFRKSKSPARSKTPEQEAAQTPDERLLARASEVVRQNLANSGFSINDFCRAMGMSRTLLFNKLKAASGKTPSEFIMSIRLENAARLLETRPEMSVTEVSEQTGFSSAHYFTQKFKSVYRMTPGAWRRR